MFEHTNVIPSNVIPFENYQSNSTEDLLKRYKLIHDNIRSDVAELDRLKNMLSLIITEKKMDACYENITVLYKAPYTRATWDSQGLKAYSKIHPAFERFKKETQIKATMIMKIH